MLGEMLGISRTFAGYLAQGGWHAAAQELVRRAVEVAGSAAGFIAVAPSKGGLAVLAHAGDCWAALARPGNAQRRATDACGEIPSGDCLVNVSVHEGRTVSIASPLGWPEAFALPPAPVAIPSLLAVPISDDDRVMGLCALIDRDGGYDEAAQSDVEALAQLGAVLCRA